MERDLRSWLALWEFFGDATLASVAAGATMGALGVHVLARRMVFFAAVLSQASGLGIVLSLLLWQVFFGAIVGHAGHGTGLAAWMSVGGVAAAAIASLQLQGRDTVRDQRLGVVWLVSTAGILMLGTYVPQAVIPNITLWMFSGRGDGGVLEPGALRVLLVVLVPIALLHLVGARGFVEVALDAVGAQVRGLPVKLLDTALLISLAAATASTTSLLGMLPAFAYSVLPAMAALRLAPNLRVALLLAAVLGATAGFLGHYLAFRWSQNVGAMQTMVCAGFATIAWAWGAMRPRGSS